MNWGWAKAFSPKRFVSEIFEDVDGGFSMKRALLLMFAVMFVVITIYVIRYGVVLHVGAKSIYAIPPETLSFLQGVLDKIVDLMKWLGSLVLLERAPQGVAAFTGNKTPNVSGEK